MNVSAGTQQVRTLGNADAWSLFYVWDYTPNDGGTTFSVDLQSRNISTAPQAGHLGMTSNTFGPDTLNANSSSGQFLTLNIQDRYCNLQLTDTRSGEVLGPNPTRNNWLMSGQSDNQLTLAFRYRDDALSSPQMLLAPGDLAIYSEPNYKGKVWVLHLSGPDVLYNDFSKVPGLNDAARSIRIGKGGHGEPTVGFLAYADLYRQGTMATIAYDIPDLAQDKRPEVRAMAGALSSITLKAFRGFITDTHGCIQCDFRHVSLPGLPLAGADLTGANFDGANVADIDFTGATLVSASLVEVYLERTHFDHARLMGAVLDGDSLTYATLNGADLSAASLQCVPKSVPKRCVQLHDMDLSSMCKEGGLNGAKLKDANLKRAILSCGTGGGKFPLAGADLTRAKLEGATLEGADLSGTTLHNTHFGQSRLAETHLERARIACSSFQNLDMRTVVGLDTAIFDNNTADCDTAQPRSDFTGATLAFDKQSLSLSGIPLPVWTLQLTLNDATGVVCTPALAGARLDNAQLNGLSMIGCAWLRGTSFMGASLIKAQFGNADLTGANLQKASLSGAHFDSATLDGAHLDYAMLAAFNNEAVAATAASLFNASLVGTSFSHATLSNVSFDSSRIIGTPLRPISFVGATLPYADFSNAFLYHVDMSSAAATTNLQGAVFQGATIVNTDFSGSNLNANQQPTKFDQAVVLGTSFSNNTSAASASFAGLIALPGPGKAALPAPRDSCLVVRYGTDSFHMQTDSRNLCPNGANGPCVTWFTKTPLPTCSKKQ